MKTQEELNEIKAEVETLNKKLHELSDEELAQVTGGGKVIAAVREYTIRGLPGVIAEVDKS